MSIDQRDFRDALGKFATGITVVTTKDENENLIGVTINSFASVSLEPPMVLFSLKNESQLCEIFTDTKNFNIGILSAGQEDISNLFAGSDDNKFSNVGWKEGQNGVPVLSGTLANLECKRAAAHPGGDHTIFVGEVTNLEQSEKSEPLLYYKGGYKTL
ncbi:flavin reductase family protein [Terasakiella sp. A23]|uniref:flavin reductase family protein n=1 Tax=Terasakiella sp. FCG-A23 TaxID=3080561 RepID=UPI002955C138|nr:flavin reductase family protein [Terasakiella sp. A23]MDV7338673.1 flavin reductase family protein [Terasakiella sp. A23]